MVAAVSRVDHDARGNGVAARATEDGGRVLVFFLNIRCDVLSNHAHWVWKIAAGIGTAHATVKQVAQ